MPRQRDVAAFDVRASGYERGLLGRLHHDIAERSLAIALALDPRPRRLLDIGCGTGYLLREAAARLPDAAQLVGIDPAPGMVEAYDFSNSMLRAAPLVRWPGRTAPAPREARRAPGFDGQSGGPAPSQRSASDRTEPRQNRPVSVVEIQHISAADTYDLRARVLRAGDLAAAHVRDDDLPGAWHLGAWCSGTLAGVASFYPRASPLATDVPAVQLRFMAVEPAMHGHGIGRALLDHVVRELREKSIRILWANGRDTALGFYTRLGFTVVGDGFIHEPGLPHHLVILGLS